MCVRGVILKRANSPPRITARRGGGVTKKTARSLLIDAAGVVFLVPSIGTPPRPRESDAARYFLDRSVTPPRGDARRGISLIQNITASFQTPGPGAESLAARATA